MNETRRSDHDDPTAARVRRPRGRPTGGETVATGDLLLDAAERIIARCGSGVSLEQIAVEAGVTKPVVYAHVGNRNALAGALAVRLADRVVAASSAALATRSARPEREFLTAIVEATLQTIAAERELFLYVTRGAPNDTPDRALALVERSAAPLADLLERWLTAQGRDARLAAPWAYGIVGMLNMVALWWTQDPDRSAGALAAQVTDLIWPGLSNSGASPPSSPRNYRG